MSDEQDEPIVIDITETVTVEVGDSGLEITIPADYPTPEYVDLALRESMEDMVLFYTDEVPETVFDPYQHVFELLQVSPALLEELLLSVEEGSLEKAFIPTTIVQNGEVVWSSVEDSLVTLEGSIRATYESGSTVTVRPERASDSGETVIPEPP